MLLERPPGTRRQQTLRFITQLPSGSFAFVMATGIVSIAAARLGFRPIAIILLAVNLIGFPLLWVLVLARFSCYPLSSSQICEIATGGRAS